jgi:pimeloyl-ACP methyl ester carboxylesterase
MHYYDKGQGETVLLLHGALSDHLSNWRMILEPLSQHRRVIAPDLRGHGLTPDFENSFSLEQMAIDIEKLLSQLNVTKVHVLASSMGGFVGLTLLKRGNITIQSLALAGVKLNWTQEDVTLRGHIFEPTKLSQLYPLWVPQLIKTHAHHHGPEHWKTLVGRVHDLLTELPNNPTITIETIKASGVPTLFAVGDEDNLVPLSDVPRFKSIMPSLEILVLNKTGHLFRDYNPTLFLASYTDFLRQVFKKQTLS